LDINIVLAILIIGFSVITVVSLGALFFIRRRELNRRDSIIISRCIEDLDAASDTSLAEINKMGALVLEEIEEKYQALLFLYNLMEDKQKELTSEVWKAPENPEPIDGDVVSDMVAQYIEAHSAKLRFVENVENENHDTQDHGTQDDTGALEDEEPDSIEVKDSPEAPAIPSPSLLFSKRPNFANPKHEQVWELHEQGQNVPDIAKQLGIGQGEVRLILELVARAS